VWVAGLELVARANSTLLDLTTAFLHLWTPDLLLLAQSSRQ